MANIGNLWKPSLLPKNLVRNQKITKIVFGICEKLASNPPKSVIVTGQSGIGKSMLIGLVAEYFETKEIESRFVTASNLKAGNRYIGDLEKAVEDLMNHLIEENEIWIAPGLHELYYAGQYDKNPIGILQQIFPRIENGEIRILAEINETDLERLLTLMPEIQNAFEIVRIQPSSKEFTVDMAKNWMANDVKNQSNKDKWSLITDHTLEELYFSSKQYLSYRENPGALMEFLKYTDTKFKKSTEKITLDSFYEALSSLTGLPISILNDKEKLDLEVVKDFFNTRVIGQEDAVKTIVERIAMIKSGLTDPSKPFGVFLFVGPTGTGKTEISKCLAEYLFSSPDRLIRLDMSEFQSMDASNKIFGDFGSPSGEGTSLVQRVRQNPFSVILLDEFEKAHPRIWDLFLQIFDDGRLTDSQGTHVDFRQSIIIMTSNVGAALPAFNRSRRALGFTNEIIEEESSSPEENVMEAIHYIFRPEFINRIDKIVVFNPLNHAALSKILDIELRNILQRRGLRNKNWDLDLEDSAVEFLLEKGYTLNLGARPLKRAIEQYLLAPLALTIVNHNFPKGDQFLFVSRKKDGLKVTFIDPDEPDRTWDQKKVIIEQQELKAENLSLPKIIMDCSGNLAEFKCIKKELTQLNEDYTKLDMIQTKTDLMNLMYESDFWTSENKQEVLSKVEYLDRFQSALNTSNKRFERLDDPEKERLHYDPNLLRELARKIYLLSESLSSFEADEPQDLLLKISYEKGQAVYGEKIKTMYHKWAIKKKMIWKPITQFEQAGKQIEVFSILGFAAYRILKTENGLHTFEVKGEKERLINRYKVAVAIAPIDWNELSQKFTHEFVQEKFENQQTSQVIRKFNLETKQIKDMIQKWQTGKMDKVMLGHFDLIGK